MGRAAKYDEDEVMSHSIGERIRSARRIRGMNMDSLANRLGLSMQQVQKYETGTNRVSVPVLMRIAEVLEFPVNYFIPDNDEDYEPAEAELVDALLEMEPEEIDAFRKVLEAPPQVRKAAVQLARTIVDEVSGASRSSQPSRRPEAH